MEIGADHALSETAAENTSTLEGALALTEQLLAADPVRAAAQAQEILRAVPGHPKALLLLASAQHALGDLAGARAILEPLAKTQPKAAAIHVELGCVLGELGETRAAIAALVYATRIAPDHPRAWRELGDQLTIAGETDKADAA